MRFLKTNTAVRVCVGPFLDVTDGKTPETALTVTNTTCELFYDANTSNAVTRAALTLSASAGNNDMVHVTDDTCGMYDLEITAANINFLGRMILTFHDDDVHLPVWHEYMVLPAMIYDAFVAGSDVLDASVTQIAGTAVDTAAAQLGVNVVNWKGSAAAAMTGDSYPIVNHVTYGNAALNTKLGTPAGASVSADVAAVKSDTAAILLDTGTDGVVVTQASADKAWGTTARTLTAATNITSNGAAVVLHTDNKVLLGGTTHTGAVVPTVTTLTGHTAQTGDAYARLGAPAGASVSADVAAVKAETAAIVADTGTDGVVVASASKTGYALSSGGIDAIFDQASSVTLTFEQLLTRCYQMVSNKMTVNESNGNVTLRNIGDASNIATGNVASSSGTTTRAELTWS